MPRLAVVVSQGQSANPAKRQLEEEIITGLLMEPGVDVIVVPHLYDLSADHTGTLALTGVSGPLVVLAWLFERGTRWTLDRLGVRGQVGATLIKPLDDDEEDDDDAEEAAAETKPRVADDRPVPKRRIYCLDLRVHAQAAPYLEEIRRISRESALQLVSLGGLGIAPPQPTPAQMARFMAPTNDTALPLVNSPAPVSLDTAPAQVTRIQADADRRWYPVIDYSRCTNCMECVDFCLFGVYGVDGQETILVEQPDNCRKGCPACSRVCPENAIIFPQHKSPAIAGADVAVEGGGLKIDLSRLFGAPEAGETAVDAAVRERDEQLLLAGRSAVGTAVGLPKRQVEPAGEKDELDNLLDELDSMDI